MNFDSMTLRDYFILKSKESFSIDPWADSSIYFGDSSLLERISRRLETDFVQPRGVPKFFVFGGYGSGKTHTLAHIAHRLRQNTVHPSEPIYVDIAPLGSKERFLRIYSRLVDGIGLDRIQAAAEAVADKISGTDKVQGFIDRALPLGDSSLVTSQANVFRNLLFGGRQAQLSWEWIKGRRNTADQAATLGVQKDLVEPQDLVNCLVNIGALLHQGTGKKPVFLIDESEAIRTVTNADSEYELRHVFRQLLENSNCYVGLIFAVQAEAGMEDIGEFFTAEDIRRRVDYDQGYIDLESMVNEVPSARDFVQHVVEYLVDQTSAADVITKEGLGTTAELFPFTEGAVNAITTHVADEPTQSSPAYILSTMSGAAIEAWRRRDSADIHVLVDEAIVEETLFPGR